MCGRALLRLRTLNPQILLGLRHPLYPQQKMYSHPSNIAVFAFEEIQNGYLRKVVTNTNYGHVTSCRDEDYYFCHIFLRMCLYRYLCFLYHVM